MSISASVGEQWRQRFCQRCGAGLRLAPPKTGQPDKSQATGLPLASKQTQCEAWDAKTLCWDAKILDHTCSHAVEFPIRTCTHKAVRASFSFSFCGSITIAAVAALPPVMSRASGQLQSA
jgi:hypothetical protein